MCTAASYKKDCFYFGRTLDYEFSYGDEIVVLPRNFPLRFRHAGEFIHHHAILGMAHVAGDYPLFYDALNEKGLCIAGLNFEGNAVYSDPAQEGCSVAQFEFIPWLLGQCASVSEARELMKTLRLVNTPFSDKLPVAQLHWLLADRDEAVTIESVRDGLKVYDNPVGVLTNNPPFPEQMFNLNNYMRLSPKNPDNSFSKKIPLTRYSRGMGAMGLPGDLSSASRFVRVTFVKENSFSGNSETERVSQFFHIMGSVDQQRGCCEVRDGEYEITLYTSCMNADKGIYYYNTYENHQISAVDMHRADLDGSTLTRFIPIYGEQILWQN